MGLGFRSVRGSLTTSEDGGPVGECSVESSHGKDTLIGSNLKSGVMSSPLLTRSSSPATTTISEEPPGDLLSLTSPVMFSGRTKLTKSESGWKSTPRECSVLLSQLCEAVGVGFPVVMTSFLIVREDRRRDGKLRVRRDSWHGTEQVPD
jgi:hypothetical protein